jgi:non-homologous end joining protein Ku
MKIMILNKKEIFTLQGVLYEALMGNLAPDYRKRIKQIIRKTGRTVYSQDVLDLYPEHLQDLIKNRKSANS